MVKNKRNTDGGEKKNPYYFYLTLNNVSVPVTILCMSPDHVDWWRKQNSNYIYFQVYC